MYVYIYIIYIYIFRLSVFKNISGPQAERIRKNITSHFDLCDLCLTEKLMIIKSNSNNLLNKRSELISKCRRESKFYLKNI